LNKLLAAKQTRNVRASKTARQAGLRFSPAGAGRPPVIPQRRSFFGGKFAKKAEASAEILRQSVSQM
jgi:hypothetical protein